MSISNEELEQIIEQSSRQVNLTMLKMREMACELLAYRSIGARPWRQGRKVPQNIYDANGNAMLMMPTAELAAVVVAHENGKHETVAGEGRKEEWRVNADLRIVNQVERLIKENVDMRADLKRVEVARGRAVRQTTEYESRYCREIARTAKAEAKVATLECEVAALRTGLEAIVRCECTFSLNHLEHANNAVEHVREIATTLLANPNPGAGIMAVVEAAVCLFNPDEGDPNYKPIKVLHEAVRALSDNLSRDKS